MDIKFWARKSRDKEMQEESGDLGSTQGANCLGLERLRAKKDVAVNWGKDCGQRRE